MTEPTPPAEPGTEPVTAPAVPADEPVVITPLADDPVLGAGDDSEPGDGGPGLPDVKPNEAAGTEEAASIGHPGVTNASPVLPPGPQTSAARAHAVLSHIEILVHDARTDIERYVPAPVLAVAKTEVAGFIQTLI